MFCSIKQRTSNSALLLAECLHVFLLPIENGTQVQRPRLQLRHEYLLPPSINNRSTDSDAARRNSDYSNESLNRYGNRFCNGIQTVNSLKNTILNCPPANTNTYLRILILILKWTWKS